MKRFALLIAVAAVALGACAGVTNSPNDSLAVVTNPTDSAGTTVVTSPGSDTTPNTTGSSTTTQPTPASSDTTVPDRTASTLPEQVPPEENTLPDGPVDTSAVPADLMAKIMTDASTRSGVPVGDIFAVRAEQALWNDGSLGCPQPNMSYTQAQVDGYWVVLKAQDQLLDYRASKSSFFVFCDTAFPGSGGAPTG
ncbi:MAG: hypothetical protein JJE47_00860 [Acidimicrobiia bacterium]|nr:hypothetical protein [Acidimicrobiia bacterium]